MKKEKQTIKQNSKSEYEIKKSKFIAFAFLLNCAEESDVVLNKLKQEYADATHICYGMVQNFRGGIEKCSDDGEPTGTAGKPILELIKKHNLTNTLICVVRYFGGIKLGAGGLLRAYVTASKQALDKAGEIPFVEYETITCTVDYSEQTEINSIIQKVNAIVVEKKFENTVIITIRVDKNLKGDFSRWI